MSATIDAKVLVYASNEADVAHVQARSLLDRLAAGPDLFYLFWPTIMGYLRMVTHPAILPRPLRFSEAAANISDLVRRPHVRTPGEAAGFWDLYLRTVPAHARGNHVPDGHLAALMPQHGVGTIYTRDRDFRAFEGITVRDPLR